MWEFAGISQHSFFFFGLLPSQRSLVFSPPSPLTSPCPISARLLGSFVTRPAVHSGHLEVNIGASKTNGCEQEDMAGLVLSLNKSPGSMEGSLRDKVGMLLRNNTPLPSPPRLKLKFADAVAAFCGPRRGIVLAIHHGQFRRFASRLSPFGWGVRFATGMICGLRELDWDGHGHELRTGRELKVARNHGIAPRRGLGRGG